jgi:hypothetical protein
MKTTDPTEELFLKEVEKHEMNVLMDNGVYRHLRFKQPGSSVAWFDIVTWPGHLAYAGDMGSFVFSRLDDMFKFFRADRGNGQKLYINQSYWGEKLEAVDRDGRISSHRRYSEDRLREHVERDISTWLEDHFSDDGDMDDAEIQQRRKSAEQELRQAVEDEVYYNVEDGEHEARKAVRDFSRKIGGHTFEFHDSWEWDCDDYTYRFTWCCYALAWAIRTYDAKVNEVPA